MKFNSKIQSGVVHTVPADLKEMLVDNPKALEVWNDITPLARNKWICWITSVKKPETRQKHLERAVADLSKGKRRPCCRPDCPHRK